MIIWLGHSAFRIAGGIYIDPYSVKKDSPPANLILISHHHYDHCSPGDIEKIIGKNTIMLANPLAAKKLAKFGENLKTIYPGHKYNYSGFDIETVPAYSIKRTFHPKENAGAGFIITVSGKRVYHAGDTDLIPEMAETRCDIALLPVSGVFVMDPVEAFEAAKLIRPALAIPMHYGSVVGTAANAQKFATLCAAEGIQAKILALP
jgi:L-ascorbate metabolism protein UlaG (beta-lactamase superfamily)